MKRTLAMQLFLGLVVLFSTCAATAQGLGSNHEPPVVKSAEVPLYPHLARAARIEGVVRVEVTTDGTSIVKMVASGAHKLLMDAAQENLKTWRFYPHGPETFTVTFVYKLEPPEVYGLVNPMVTLNLPNRVEIRTKLHTVEGVTTDTPD